MVKVNVRTAGPARPHALDLPPKIEVCALRMVIAEKIGLPHHRLKLVLHGRPLHDLKNDQPAFAEFTEGDSIIAIVAPKAPPAHIQNKYGLLEDEDEDLRFRIPETAPQFQRRFAYFLRDNLRIPDIVLMLAFSLSLRAWLMVILWFIVAPIAHRWDLGPLYILATAFAIIFFNLGKREEGEASAYSIFNEGFRELPGTLNADRLDRDLRAGQF